MRLLSAEDYTNHHLHMMMDDKASRLIKRSDNRRKILESTIKKIRVKVNCRFL